MPPSIDRSTLTFLATLNKHNNRDWFNANKDMYQVALDNMRAFADALLDEMKKHDRIATESGKESLMRIYNDLRFHKDKPPYNPRFAGNMDRMKPQLRGGYYYHIEPGKSFLSCGFFGPESADLKLIRSDVAYDHRLWKKLLESKAMRSTFEPLAGDQLITAPKGYTPDHPAIELLRRKQFIFRRRLTDEQVVSAGFVDEVNKTFKTVRPWFDHMSGVLTSDGNGA
jgi:uncharacterized protein (TIGR02453 family)